MDTDPIHWLKIISHRESKQCRFPQYGIKEACLNRVIAPLARQLNEAKPPIRPLTSCFYISEDEVKEHSVSTRMIFGQQHESLSSFWFS